MRILAVGAHPDDVEIGCGGTLLRHVRQGHDVHVLVLTAGEGGGPSPHIRRKEAIEAAECLGATIHFGNLSALDFSTVRQERVETIERVVQIARPDRVYAHNEHDRHQNHVAAAGCTMIATRDVREVLSFYLPSTTVEFHPNVYSDITAEFEGKMWLLSSYSSQRGKAYMQEEFLHSKSRVWAVEGNVPGAEALAEAFRVERMVWSSA